MNECIKVLQTRRSIKKYKSTPVPENMLNEILKAGINAPTGRNMQAPVMVVVTNPDTIAQIASVNERFLTGSGDPFYGAPVLVIVFSDSEIFTHKEDGCMVMANLLNAATSLGLGACWIHRAKETFETPEGKRLMEKWGLDSRYVGIGNCIIGYPDETREPKQHKDNYVIFDA